MLNAPNFPCYRINSTHAYNTTSKHPSTHIYDPAWPHYSHTLSLAQDQRWSVHYTTGSREQRDGRAVSAPGGRVQGGWGCARAGSMWSTGARLCTPTCFDYVAPHPSPAPPLLPCLASASRSVLVHSCLDALQGSQFPTSFHQLLL